MNTKHNDTCHDPHMKAFIEALWSKVCQNFATRSSVAKLANELQKLETGRAIQSTQVAQAAAALVIREVRKDIDNIKDDLKEQLRKNGSFSVEICTIADKFNRPAIRDPKFNTIYLTPSDKPEHEDAWDEWIAIPRSLGNRVSFKWERLGAAKVDLSWVKQDFKTVQHALKDLNDKIARLSQSTADAILKAAVKPIEEIQNYLSSQEFLDYLQQNLPKAAVGQDGLMTSGMVAMLQGLALWAGNDHRSLGGGALGADYVIRAMEYYGINCDDLKTAEGGDKVIYPEFNFPKS